MEAAPTPSSSNRRALLGGLLLALLSYGFLVFVALSFFTALASLLAGLLE